MKPKASSVSAMLAALAAELAPAGRPGPEWFTVYELMAHRADLRRDAAFKVLAQRVKEGSMETRLGVLDGKRVRFYRVKP